ncbi:unnamed protein product, partial [marine sediment metagenome]
MKASSAISEEIVLPSLLKRMMQIMLENAGAEKAVYLIKRQDQWLPAAICETRHKENILIADMNELKDYSAYPANIINYVRHTLEPLVLENAADTDEFSKNEYIKNETPKSVLCMPIIYHDTPQGLLYLENKNISGVFNKNRLSVLKMLAAQAGISLENARHFEEMKRHYISTERFVPKRLLKLLGKENVDEIKLGDCIEREISVFFNDIRGFTLHVEKKTPTDAFAFVNRYWDFMAPIIREHSGYIDHYSGDSILAVFPRDADDAVSGGIAL